MLHYILLALIAAMPVPNLPESLQRLAPLWQEEEALVDAIRAMDKANGLRIDQLTKPPKPGNPPLENAPDTAEAARAELKQLAGDVRTAYELAIDTYDNNARLRNYYGEWLYDRYGEEAAAMKAWQQALGMDKELSAAYNNLGLHYFHVGQYDIGLRHMDLALKYDKNNPDYLFNMVNLYLVHAPQLSALRKWSEVKLYKEAMKLSKRAVKAAPEDYDLLQDYAVNFYAAENYGLKADWKDAAAAWQQARAKARTEEETFYCWLNEGRVWLRGEKPENAIPCLNEALRIRPDSIPARQLLESVQDVSADKKSEEATE